MWVVILKYLFGLAPTVLSYSPRLKKRRPLFIISYIYIFVQATLSLYSQYISYPVESDFSIEQTKPNRNLWRKLARLLHVHGGASILVLILLHFVFKLKLTQRTVFDHSMPIAQPETVGYQGYTMALALLDYKVILLDFIYDSNSITFMWCTQKKEMLVADVSYLQGDHDTPLYTQSKLT